MTGVLLVVLLLAYVAFHGHHVRRNRHRGLGLWVSLRGPWGTRISRRF